MTDFSLLSITQAAEFLNTTPAALRAWISRGYITAPIKMGNKQCYTLNMLKEFVLKKVETAQGVRYEHGERLRTPKFIPKHSNRDLLREKIYSRQRSARQISQGEKPLESNQGNESLTQGVVIKTAHWK